MTVPRSEIQTLTPGALWTGWKIDMAGIGGSAIYLSPGVNDKGSGVVWQGQTYDPFPIAGSGFEVTTQGQLPRPTVSVAALDGRVGALIASLDDLVGAIVTRKRALVKYLDAANWNGGNPSADPSAGFEDDIWILEQKTSESFDVITFSLSALTDFQGLKIPSRLIQTSTCPWTYKGTECGYAGAISSCDRGLTTPNGCRAHFPTGALPFGGFPGALSLMGA